MKKTIFSLSLLLLTVTLSAQLYFEDVAAAWGIDHSYLSSRLGGGVSCYDFDGDGWDDLTLATAEGETIHFYKNMNGSFVRLPDLVPTTEEAKQILWVDFDNDGDQDLFIASFNGINRLYEQTGPLEFTDVTTAAGLFGFFTDTYGACFGDYNRDGWVDLYFGVRLIPSQGGDQHVLFHNNGDGTFTNVTTASNTIDENGRPFCSAFIDYNNDLWPDIYTAHDRYNNTNTLLENQGDGTFISQGGIAGAAIAIDAMSVTHGDYNNDGYFDILCTNTNEGTNLLRNNGPNENGQYTFTETGLAAGVGFFGVGWGASFLDADNDTDLDLYISGAAVGSDVISAAFYYNENDGTFSESTEDFIGDTTSTYNNAIGDFNNDGYPEIAVINTYPFQSKLWSSEAGTSNWLKIELRGIESNRNGIGSRIECYSNGVYQQRFTQCGTGFMGQHSGTQIIGLGTAELLDSVIVSWPSGQVDRYHELAAQQKYLLPEGGIAEELPPLPAAEPPIILTHLAANNTTQAVLLYPSPGKEELTIVQDRTTYQQFKITTVQGQTVLTGKLDAEFTQFDVSFLPAGPYFIHLSSNQGSQQTLSWIKS